MNSNPPPPPTVPAPKPEKPTNKRADRIKLESARKKQGAGQSNALPSPAPESTIEPPSPAPVLGSMMSPMIIIGVVAVGGLIFAKKKKWI